MSTPDTEGDFQVGRVTSHPPTEHPRKDCLQNNQVSVFTLKTSLRSLKLKLHIMRELINQHQKLLNGTEAF